MTRMPVYSTLTPSGRTAQKSPCGRPMGLIEPPLVSRDISRRMW